MRANHVSTKEGLPCLSADSSSYFLSSYGSVKVQVLVEDVLKMSRDRGGVVCSRASPHQHQSPPAPCICKLELEAGSSFILILLLCPDAAAADEAGGGAAGRYFARKCPRLLHKICKPPKTDPKCRRNCGWYIMLAAKDKGQSTAVCHQTDGCCSLLQNVTHPPTLQWASSKPHKLQQQPTVIIIMYF